MSISFQDARATISAPTEPEGFEDEEAYLLLLTDPPLDDTVILVAKRNGEVRQDSRWRISGRLDRMTPITEG